MKLLVGISDSLGLTLYVCVKVQIKNSLKMLDSPLMDSSKNSAISSVFDVVSDLANTNSPLISTKLSHKS